MGVCATEWDAFRRHARRASELSWSRVQPSWSQFGPPCESPAAPGTQSRSTSGNTSTADAGRMPSASRIFRFVSMRHGHPDSTRSIVNGLTPARRASSALLIMARCRSRRTLLGCVPAFGRERVLRLGAAGVDARGVDFASEDVDSRSSGTSAPSGASATASPSRGVAGSSEAPPCLGEVGSETFVSSFGSGSMRLMHVHSRPRMKVSQREDSASVICKRNEVIGN